MLQVDKLHQYYGGSHILRGLSFLIVPTLRVGMPPGTLRVPLPTHGSSPAQW